MNSGRWIVSILELRHHNRYDLMQENGGFYANMEFAQIRRVVAYCRRHYGARAEGYGDRNIKSYRSLQDWVMIR
jgi:hypothetical protein